MEQLTIIGSEGRSLVLVSESGARFSLPINDVLRTELRKARSADDAPQAPRARPRDIQMHVRAGMPAEEVAQLLGTTLADVQRYEAPVLAERAHIVDQALGIPVLLGTELEPDGTLSFGAAIRGKLAELEATGETWTSWKDEDGWSVKVTFTANDVEHDARWGFEPRRSTLTPLNSTATQLSRKGSMPDGLIPRLRALDADQAPAPSPFKDESRFDSGAFGPRHFTPITIDDDAETESPRPSKGRTSVIDAAVKRAPEPTAPTHPDTADLLEALRRRRGQRDAAPAETAAATQADDDSAASDDASAQSERTHAAPRSLFADRTPVAEPADEQVHEDDDEIVAEKQAAERERAAKPRRGRPSMPSWDDIVFGARTED